MSSATESNSLQLTCRYCDQTHRRVSLAPGEHADCVRCGSVLERGGGLGLDGGLAWSMSGLFLAVPAFILPLASVDRLGLSHEGLWLTGVGALWRGQFQELAAAVLFLGAVAPVGLLALLTTLFAGLRRERPPDEIRSIARWARHFQRWSMPEVYLLAVLVAFIKLGALANVTIDTGLWCYGGMAFALVKASRSFDLSSAKPDLA